MDESRFHRLADQVLEQLADQLDDVLGDRLDVELDHGILTLTLPSRAQYVINKHGPMRQIWMSSPVSGASHYGHQQDDVWVSTRDEANQLRRTVLAEISAAFGISLT